ncbi:galactoside-binding lectin [Ancylostoma duodenale]|uniref:Galectin n=1 Tax=Ancylostoma duodenale TaxID=51022 RepID=A0A0C2FTT7_9BILA|nr:galactoside-binding lectin [Ancylostoma duodenale]
MLTKPCFQIDLKNGDDIILHFNPRLKDELLVFNSFYAGAWQDEERASVVFPFLPKRMYTVDFVASGENTVYVSSTSLSFTSIFF